MSAENNDPIIFYTGTYRSGPTGTARLAFLPHYTRFANMARQP